MLNKNEVTKNNNSNKKARVNFLLIQNKTACNNNHRKSATVAGATSVCTGTAAAVLLLCRSSCRAGRDGDGDGNGHRDGDADGDGHGDEYGACCSFAAPRRLLF